MNRSRIDATRISQSRTTFDTIDKHAGSTLAAAAAGGWPDARVRSAADRSRRAAVPGQPARFVYTHVYGAALRPRLQRRACAYGRAGCRIGACGRRAGLYGWAGYRLRRRAVRAEHERRAAVGRARADTCRSTVKRPAELAASHAWAYKQPRRAGGREDSRQHRARSPNPQGT